MPGTQTALTSRLEISRRQFFQWHFVEKRHIPQVKQKMDDLTLALKLAGYDYDFIAEEKAWKSRSRRWNTLRKTAWKVEPGQKGRGLPIPADIADVPVWVEWDQDVGDWRKGRPREENDSSVPAAPAGGQQEPSQSAGHRDAVTQVRNNIGPSHAPPMSSPTASSSPHLLNLKKEDSTTPQSMITGTTAWPQQNHSTLHSLSTGTAAWPHTFTSMHPPSISQSEQTLDTQYHRAHVPNPWYQNYPTATSAPPSNMSISNAAPGNKHGRAAFTRDNDLSHASPESRSASASGSGFREFPGQGQSGYQSAYIPQPSSLGSPCQHWSADFSGAQVIQAQGMPVSQWTPSQWNSHQHDSGSSQGTNGT